MNRFFFPPQLVPGFLGDTCKNIILQKNVKGRLNENSFNFSWCLFGGAQQQLFFWAGVINMKTQRAHQVVGVRCGLHSRPSRKTLELFWWTGERHKWKEEKTPPT